jgi:hypothetical protein
MKKEIHSVLIDGLVLLSIDSAFSYSGIHIKLQDHSSPQSHVQDMGRVNQVTMYRMWRRKFISLVAFMCLPAMAIAQIDASATAQRRSEERLTFQTGQPWTPRTNLNADVAMVYGIGPLVSTKIETWVQRGYIPSVMTGVAWGSYQDYLDGRFDGTNHRDQAQKDANGKEVLHGGNKDIPYMSPGASYGTYLSQGVQRGLDAGATSIYLEEPEFWARSGWEENFKREWRSYYGEDWQPPNSSPDAQYRASKLKYYLYRRSLSQVFDFVKQYGEEHHRKIPCYVATHSLINYANWAIVSPESSLLGVGADGYIAQVWTGTARTPNYYEGVLKERTFETAFLEYGSMQNLVRTSGRRMWYLNDPIEDNPNHDWNDYRENWENTLTASLLQPDVWSYEIMPWPERIFNGQHPIRQTLTATTPFDPLKHPVSGAGAKGPGSEATVQKIGIPAAYASELQDVITALGDMKQSHVQWERAGTQGVGVLISDTMMFQRAAPSPSDAVLGSFFGLALPLLKHGVPVEPVQIENSTTPESLDRYKLLILTYEGQKPPTPLFHDVLAVWVRKGGILVAIDNDDDPYNKVREWWNTSPNSFKTPREHLFSELHIPEDAAGLYRVGRGVVLSERESPAASTYSKAGADKIRGYVRQAARAGHLKWSETNALVLRRGPYVVAAGLDESLSGATPYTLHGKFINLFDPALPVLHQVTVGPNSRFFLVDLNALSKSEEPIIVAASCRIRSQQNPPHQFTFSADGIAETEAFVRIATGRTVSRVMVNGVRLSPLSYRQEDGTVRIEFPNSIDSVQVEVDFQS